MRQWDTAGVPLTDVALTVTKPIMEAKKKQQIVVTQTGGLVEKDGKTYRYILEGDPLMAKGEEYLVFLRSNQEGTYSILGGPQGKFKNIQGKIHSMKEVTGDEHVIGRIDVKGESADVLEQRLVEKVKVQKK